MSGSVTPPNWQASDFFAQFQKVLPRGRIWRRDAAAVQTQVLAAFMPTVQRWWTSVLGLLVDAFPATTVELLTEWNETLGLPDSCTPLAATVAEQQAQIIYKLTQGTGQSVAYYISVAARLGYTITITEGAASTFTWTVNIPSGAPPILFRAGQSRAGDLLEKIISNTQLECIFNKIKPAHTVLVFNYE